MKINRRKLLTTGLAGGAAAADVQLIEQPKSGRYALRLSAGGPRRAVERPPLEIISPSVACQPGQVVCIHCWVRATAPPGGGTALEIETWPGGPEMAERVRALAEWRELNLYRVADDDGQVRVRLSADDRRGSGCLYVELGLEGGR